MGRKKITWFDGTEYDFLSNFHPSPWVRFDGQTVMTVEHAFQAAKTNDAKARRRILNARTPGDAKAMGRSRSLALRTDWDQIKYEVMLGLLREKFRNSPLTEKLIDTGEAKLIEGNSWHDNIWGDCQCGRAQCARTKGTNWLGKALMQVRREIVDGVL